MMKCFCRTIHILSDEFEESLFRQAPSRFIALQDSEHLVVCSSLLVFTV